MLDADPLSLRDLLHFVTMSLSYERNLCSILTIHSPSLYRSTQGLEDLGTPHTSSTGRHGRVGLALRLA